MSGRGRPGRYVLAPVRDGAAAWDAGVDLVVAPVRLSHPVRVVLARHAPRSAR